MKLFDKIKDLFMDEVEIEDDIDIEEEEQVETKVELPKVMRDTILEEEKKEDKVEFRDFSSFDNKVEEKKEEVKTEPKKKFSFPIEFEEDIPKRETKNVTVNVATVSSEKKEPIKKVAELYPDKRPEFKAKPKFKATPVISPVYGVLDKNYTKEEVKEKDEDNVIMKRPSKKVDFETVRKKAFGNLSDDIKDNLLCENCELYKEVKKIQALSEDDLLYDMTVDEDEEKMTINKAYENYEEFGVAYEAKTPSSYEKEDDTSLEDIIIKDNNEEEVVLEKADIVIPEEKVVEEKEEDKKDEVEEDVPSRKKNKETKVDDDFFDLIDSMYKERADE